GCTVTEEGDADVVAALGARAHAHADRVTDAGRHDAVRAEQADRTVVQMHGPAATAAAAVALAEQLGHQDLRIHSLRQRMAVPAMRRGDPVGRSQMRADADRGRFLADVEVQEAGRLTLTASDLRD